MSEINGSKAKSEGKKCCVTNCEHRDVKNKGEFHFYHVLRARNQEQSESWVKVLKKHNGAEWNPSKFTVICSAHFVSGEYSSIQNHPDYIPSIFPENDFIKPKSVADVERANRTLDRNSAKLSQSFELETENAGETQETQTRKFKDQSTWTEQAEYVRPPSAPKPARDFNDITKQVYTTVKMQSQQLGI